MTPELVRLAQETTSAGAFEAGVLAHLEREVGFEVAFFGVKGELAAPATIGLDLASTRRFLANERAYFDEILPVKRAALAARGVAVDTDVLGEGRVREMRYHREMARPLGGRHSLLAYVPFRGQIAGVLMLGRTGSTFSERDRRRIESFLLELGVARAVHGWPVPTLPLEPLQRRRAVARGELPPSGVASGLLGRLGFRGGSRTLSSVPTSTGHLVVRDRGGFREMVAARAGSELVWTRAALRDPGESGWPYVDLFHLAAALAQHRRSALFIGCGGAVALRQFARVYPGITLTVVEREAAVVELSRECFALDEIPGLSVQLADGVEFVARAAKASWDVAVIDAYDDADVDAALTRPSFFRALRQALCPGGAMAFNVIGSLDGHGAVGDVVRAARGAFEAVRAVPVIVPGERCEPGDRRNVVIVARRAT